MKKSCILSTCFASFVTFALLMGIAAAAPYGPKGREVAWVQPNGQHLKLRVFGDDFYARTETLDGYSVVYNAHDRSYHYAQVAPNGRLLVPSGRQAHLPPALVQAKHLDLSDRAILSIHQANRTRLIGDRDLRWNQRVQAVSTLRDARLSGGSLRGPAAAAAAIQAAPVEGRKLGLTILVQFPDDPKTSGSDPTRFPTTRGKMINFCNKIGYNDDGNTGSVRDYFFDQSLGKLIYTQQVSPIVTLPQPRNYYNFENYPTNTRFRFDSGRLLIADAIQILDRQGYDFSKLTLDADNNVLATNLFFAGPDSGVWAQGLWPYQWSMETPVSVGTPGNPIFINNFQVTNIENAAPVIGTYVHESGHLLMDYPDLYDVVGEGVGEHCLMGSGNYLNDGKTPSPINAYLKDVVGWANITDLTIDDFITHTLPSTGNIAYRIYNPAIPAESFVFENRGVGDKWAQHSDDKGIAIWHVDERVDGNIQNPFGLPQKPHYQVALEQADGRQDLENGANRGDATDLFDLSDPLFSDTSRPNSRWWTGALSSIRAKVLSGLSPNIRVQFGTLPPDTILVDSPSGGEVAYHDSVMEIKWEANVVGSLRIDLLEDGKFSRRIASSAPNSGKYSWRIPGSTPTGKNFKVRIVTVTNPKTVFALSQGTFEISGKSFPAGNAMPRGWYKPSSASVGWKVTRSGAYEGSHCLTSRPMGDRQSAGIAYSNHFKKGTISFYLKVSTEQEFDYLRFYINGIPQVLSEGVVKRGLSGSEPYTFFSFPVATGNRTFEWIYQKDDSYSSGADSVWLDGVALPPTSQEIAVLDPKGKSLISSRAKVEFPMARIGQSSKPQIFTIINRGKADLLGLRVDTKGLDGGSFITEGLRKTRLKAGEKTTFRARFVPRTPGAKSGHIRIFSNDDNERPFIIYTSGNAAGIPEIALRQPSTTPLTSGKSVRNFGYSPVHHAGKTMLFTVRNSGSAILNGLTVRKYGAARNDFLVGALGTDSLAPGKSTTFKVTFKPSRRNEREAFLRIGSNYKPGGEFHVNLKGVGVPPGVASSAASRSADLVRAVLGSPAAGESLGTDVVTRNEVIGGVTYKVLVAAKPSTPDGLIRTVEVSPNLIDWYSGALHTTVMSDNERYLKVRDNTPAAPSVKRYIRLKTTRP